jgi:hypothetical protein
MKKDQCEKCKKYFLVKNLFPIESSGSFYEPPSLMYYLCKSCLEIAAKEEQEYRLKEEQEYLD